MSYMTVHNLKIQTLVTLAIVLLSFSSINCRAYSLKRSKTFSIAIRYLIFLLLPLPLLHLSRKPKKGLHSFLEKQIELKTIIYLAEKSKSIYRPFAIL